MKHSTFDPLKPLATVTKMPALSKRDVRRQRLMRFATLLDAHQDSIRLFRQIEFMDDSERRSLRSDSSPLTIAFADPVLRDEGLKSDEFGEAVEFFDLTEREAHQLLCDCHFLGVRPSSQILASRVRTVANQKTLRQHWQVLSQRLVAWLATRLKKKG